MSNRGIIHQNGQKCDTDQCAAFSNSYIRSLGNTTNGNAWNLKDADLIYSGYNTENRPRKYDQSSVEQYNYEAADTLYRDFKSGSLDKDKIYAVNMFYKGSPSLKTAYKDGRDDIAGTHTGYLQYNPTTKRWTVVHNIHGTIHVDDFIGIQGSDGKYGVTAIFEPYNKKDRSFLQRMKNFFFAEGGQIENNDEWYDIYINNKNYKVMLVVSESDKERGLQDVEELDSNEGMLFDYVDDPQSEISFWMKDTTLALDIVFINDSGIVEDVKHGEPLSEELLTCVPNEGSIIYVLEVLSGSGIKPGDKFSINKNETEDESTEKSLENNLEILGSDGEVQATLQGGERIFSIKNTKTLVAMAKRAYESKSDSDYKALGRKIFEYMKIQNEREPEYVNE